MGDKWFRTRTADVTHVLHTLGESEFGQPILAEMQVIQDKPHVIDSFTLNIHHFSLTAPWFIVFSLDDKICQVPRLVKQGHLTLLTTLS